MTGRNKGGFDIHAQLSAALGRRDKPAQSLRWIHVVRSLAGRTSHAATAFVWGIWAFLFVAALAFTWKHAAWVPYQDDWCFRIPSIAGEQPLTAAWLWEEYGEYRFPLTKLAIVLLDKYLGYQGGAYVAVCVLGLLAFAMILVARRLRGWTRYSDAFFPVALLHWGHCDNLLGSTNVGFVIAMALIGALLLFLARRPAPLSPAAAALFALCLVLIPMSDGLQGIPYVFLLTFWLAYAGVSSWYSHETHSKRKSLWLLGSALGIVLILAIYLLDYQFGNTAVPTSSDPLTVLKGAVTFLGMGFGQAAVINFPRLSHVSIFSLLTISVILLVIAWCKHPQERLRSAGLLLFVCGVVGLAVGAGWKRSIIYPIENQARYVLFASPALWCVYYVWEIYGTRLASRLIQLLLFVIMFIMLPVNARTGLEYSRSTYQESFAKFEQDLAAGLPPSIIAERQASNLMGSNDEDIIQIVASGLRTLKTAGISKYRYIPDDPVMRDVSVPLHPTTLERMTWKNGVARGRGGESGMIFGLVDGRFVYAIRVTYVPEKAMTSPGALQVCWKKNDREDFTENDQMSSCGLENQPGEWKATIWVNDVVDQFRFKLFPADRPFVFHIVRIDLLVPGDG